MDALESKEMTDVPFLTLFMFCLLIYFLRTGVSAMCDSEETMENPIRTVHTTAYVDSHFHGDIVQYSVPMDFTKYEKGGAGISWSYVHEPASWDAYPSYFASLEDLACSTSKEKFPLYYLVGVHPRSLPPEPPLPESPPPEIADEEPGSSFWSGLMRHVRKPLCLGLGELGLETGSEREVSILRKQLVWAASSLPGDKKIGIHTPRKNKARMTAMILDLLNEMPALHPRVVIDHVNAENVDMVRNAGLMMGMTIQEGKMTAEMLVQLLEKYPDLENRIMLNSDSALSLAPEYQKFVTRDVPGISRKLHTKLVRDTACAFWGIGVY